MPIRLVAIDLDGTLLTDSKEIGQETAAALREVSVRGVHVVIATARPPRSVRPFHAQLGLDTLQINYNGALIWDEGNRRVLFHCPMPGATVGRVITHARSQHPQCVVSLEILVRWYTDRFDQTHTTQTGRLFKPDYIGPLDAFLSDPVTKLMILGPHRMILDIEESLGVFADDVATVRCDDDLIQIMDHRVSKAAALRTVAEHYGISMADCLAIGDAPNDMEMLESAGIAVAVANAHPSVKQIAHWIAPDNNSHGVLAALRHYGLCAV